MDQEAKLVAGIIFLIFSVFCSIIFFFMWILPVYGVWHAGQRGQATLKEADYSRQTKVVEAQANLEAEKLNAQAEVVRAGGVAQSNNIVKASISDAYIKYLWVKTLDGANKEIIYVPTEANLPLTEAGKAVK